MTRTRPTLDIFSRDIRYACAALARDPGFTVVIVLILALGIGANTAMFSLVDAVLVKPLPFAHPERVVRVWEAPTPATINQTTAFNFAAWKRLSTSFEAIAAEHRTEATAAIDGEPTRLAGKLVSASYFDVFAVRPLVGRTFTAAEDQAEASPVIVLSHAAWQARFAGDRGVLNRDLVLDGVPHRIVGVMPPGVFDRDDMASAGEDPAAFWKPLVFTPRQLAASEHWLWVAARLRAGTTPAQAQQEMRGVRAALAAGYPSYKKEWGITVEPFDKRLVDDTLRQSLYVGFGAVAIVLLIACANVTNLLLGKSLARTQEMAVRAALGASRGRLVRQLLTESLVLCGLGAIAGVVLAAWLIEVAMRLLPVAVPSTAVASLDYRVLGFAAAAAVGVALLVGLVPSLRASAGGLSLALNQSSRGSSGPAGRLRRIIVAAEVALSLVLICGGLLLFKSLLNLQRVDLGVTIDNVVTISTELPAAGYPTPDAAAAFFRSILERLEALPGVARASLADDAPLEGAGGENVRLPGGTDRALVRYKRVGPGYFSALQIPLIAGREFTDADGAGAVPVTVISQELARILADRFGIADPVGRLVSLPSLGYEGGATRVNMQIVGVIRGERVQRNLRLPREPVAYVPLLQAPRRAVNFILRTHDNPGAVLASIRQAVRQTDARLALSRVRTMAQIRRERSLSGTTEPAWIVGAFAAIAALLAGLGVYGVLAHMVAQQRREIGIRMALGATGRAILTRVLRSAGLMIAIGLTAGLGGALALTRVLSSLLFEVSPLDRGVLVSAAGVMAVLGLIAASLPAVRASRVDPATVLRGDG